MWLLHKYLIISPFCDIKNYNTEGICFHTTPFIIILLLNIKEELFKALTSGIFGLLSHRVK